MQTVYTTTRSSEAQMVLDQSIYLGSQGHASGHSRARGQDALAHGSLYSLRKGTATHHYHPSQHSKSWLPASRGRCSLLPSPGCGWRDHPLCHQPHACILLRKKKTVLTGHRLLPAQSPPRQLATQKSRLTGTNYSPTQKTLEDWRGAQDEHLLAWQGHEIPGNDTI